MLSEMEFVKVCLELAELKEREAILNEQITLYVLGREKTQSIGSVKATYRKPRKTWHYDKAWEKYRHMHSDVNEDDYTKVTKRVDYRALCNDAGITDIEYVEADPKVSIKVEI